MAGTKWVTVNSETEGPWLPMCLRDHLSQGVGPQSLAGTQGGGLVGETRAGLLPTGTLLPTQDTHRKDPGQTKKSRQTDPRCLGLNLSFSVQMLSGYSVPRPRGQERRHD